VPPVGLLFVFLAACFLGLAVAAGAHGGATGWVIALAGFAVAAWFGEAAFRMSRRRR
jgi:hypothetical protein